jgi:hypothetical protein
MGQKFELKRLSREGLASALEKAQRYRLLEEPQEAESICLDILAVEPTHAQARITLILALSDQLAADLSSFEEAMQVVAQLEGYERLYYEGILCERRAKAHHRSGKPFSGSIAHDWFVRAMTCFEAAIVAPSRPAGNEDAILRWNTCARLLMRHAELTAQGDEPAPPVLLE